MALTATLYNFDIELSDVDRGVYETIGLRVACHPSETDEYLVTRVLAYCLEYAEGITFGKGLSAPDEPAITVRDLTGTLLAWIEVGAPDAARLHKANKGSPRVAVYTHKDPRLYARQLAGEKIHRAEAIELYSIDRDLLAELASRLEKRVKMAIAISDRHLYVTINDDVIEGAIERHALVSE